MDLMYYLMPHPPIMIPEVGRGEEAKIIHTTNACLRVAQEIKEFEPEVIIVITPHGVMFQDAVSICMGDNIKGSLTRFQASSVKLEKVIDQELTKEIITRATKAKIPVVELDEKTSKDYRRNFELDHGTIVPLYYIEKEYSKYKIVHITYGLIKDLDLFRLGTIIKEVVQSMNKKAVVIASGDLSHRLTKDGPYPYSPKGKEFDDTFLSLLEKGDALGILNLNQNLMEEAGECGYRSVLVMLGTINTSFYGELYSYEGPFGVGYGIMKLTCTPGSDNILEKLEEINDKSIKNKKASTNPYVRLARESIEYYLQNRKRLPAPSNTPAALLTSQAGVFVSLKKWGHLRGCIGTFLPTTESIAKEIIENAISAAVRDPRFPPVDESELNDLDISVDILSKPTSAKRDELDPKIYGVIVSQGYKKGLLLPNLEGVETINKQLTIACQKAGIDPKSEYEIEKFTVTRYYEGDNDDK